MTMATPTTQSKHSATPTTAALHLSIIANGKKSSGNVTWNDMNIGWDQTGPQTWDFQFEKVTTQTKH